MSKICQIYAESTVDYYFLKCCINKLRKKVSFRNHGDAWVAQRLSICLRSRWPPWKMCAEVRGQFHSPMTDSQKKCHRLLYLYPALTSEAPFNCKTLCFTYYPSLVFTAGC
uniref:Uncharacterized protein n=1 Tax=Canis lupus familiaris TaxID=9615 RepID=A0A8C0N509_CANLF